MDDKGEAGPSTASDNLFEDLDTGSTSDDLFSEVNLATPPPQGTRPRLAFSEEKTSSEGHQEGGDSPSTGDQEGSKGGDQYNPFDDLSPPTSPVAKPENEPPERNLEDSSEDIPKSKLDVRMETKMLDLESPISGPGRSRNIPVVEEEEHSDLKVSIVAWEKHGNKTESYVVYKLRTEIMRPNHLYEKSQYDVWRRYKDFEWLREQVEKSHPTLIVPPLPGKQLIRYFDHSCDEFLRERQKALEKFLKRLTLHPYFSFNKSLKSFLSMEYDDFTVHVAENSPGGNKLFGMVSSSVRQATTSLMLKNADPDFAKHARYFSDLGEKMTVIERIASRLHTEREELAHSMDDFSLAVFQWATAETQMSQPLQRLASCMENCHAAVSSLNDANGYSLMASAKEYNLYCAAGVSAVKRRDALQLEKERMAEDRDKKKKLHEEAISSGKIQKVPKHASDLEKTGLAAERALDELSQANEKLRVDVEKWHEAKNKEISQLMRKFSDNHITYHQKCFNEWEKMLQLLKNLKTKEDKDSLKEEASSVLEDSQDSSS